MLDIQNPPCSFHNKIAVPRHSQMVPVYFALVLSKKSNFELWKAWKKGVTQEGRTQKSNRSVRDRWLLGQLVSHGHEETSTWVTLFLWITWKKSVLLCCLQMEIRGKKKGSVYSLTVILKIPDLSGIPHPDVQCSWELCILSCSIARFLAQVC